MKVIICDSKRQIAQKAGDMIIKRIRENPYLVLGLATGSTPIPLYQYLVNNYQNNKVNFENVISFNLDEYLDNNDQMQSYRYFMNTNLFDYINIPIKKTFFPSKHNYKYYDELIKQAGGIDIQILGIGRNGHIGFNEPGTAFDSKTHIVKLTDVTIKDNARFFNSIDDVPCFAVTMGLNTIMQSKEIILIATGKNKATAIKQMLDNYDVNCPASILKNHQNVTVYLDNDAAEFLTKKE